MTGFRRRDWEEKRAKGWGMTQVYAARTCRRKIRFTDSVEALKAYIELGTRGDWCVGFHVYLCRHCQGYHLGHKATHATIKRFNRLMVRKVVQKLMGRLVAAQRH